MDSQRAPPQTAGMLTELSILDARTVQARAELARLERDIVEAEDRLDRSEAAQLIEANEQLVLGILRVRTEAETTASALGAASRSAQLDVLTRLPNRVLLRDRLTQAIANAKRHGTRGALLFVDLDNFKQINDTLGHTFGDHVLERAARCLESTVRAADTVSRHGGDEFLILLSEVSEPADAARIAEKVLAALAMPSLVGAHVMQLAASVGISIYPDDGEDAGSLIDAAGAAMYRAKRTERGSFASCSDSLDGERRDAVPASSPRPLTGHEQAAAEHHLRHVQLREANEQLVLAAFGAQELQRAAEMARQHQTELLALVAHELRNPLAPIRTAAALLPRVTSQELPRLQAIIERQVQRVTRLAGDLLDVSRAGTGKLRLQVQRMDLVGVLDEAIDTCRPAMDLRLQRLSVRLPEGPVELEGDAARLAQVFTNLLDNASKYTPDGGEVALSVLMTAEGAVITVADSGIGITP